MSANPPPAPECVTVELLAFENPGLTPICWTKSTSTTVIKLLDRLICMQLADELESEWRWMHFDCVSWLKADSSFMTQKDWAKPLSAFIAGDPPTVRFILKPIDPVKFVAVGAPGEELSLCA